MTWKTSIEQMDWEIIPFASCKLKRFFLRDIEKLETKIGAVDLTLITGTTHAAYAEKTWFELRPVSGTLGNDVNNLPSMDRAGDNYQWLQKNPNYYFSTEEKKEWSFYCIEGKYFIDEGNHRTVIGRLFLYLNNQPQLIHGVRITHGKFKTRN
jgi:hypothetical protein